MTGTPRREPPAPAPERGHAAAQPATTAPARPRQRLLMAVTLPGQIDITQDCQAQDRLVLGGDIDEDTYPALVEALNHVPPDHASLHIDLSAVTFCDLAGLRAIIRLADTDTSVILHGVPRPLRTVMTILGWDQEPGLMISKH